jgi:hypothetical protein
MIRVQKISSNISFWSALATFIVVSATTSITSAAHAQEGRTGWAVCHAKTVNGYVSSKVIKLEKGMGDLPNLENEWKRFTSEKASCTLDNSENDANFREQADRSNEARTGNRIELLGDWQPSFIVPQSNTHTLTLDFEPGDGSGFRQVRRGYKRASIKLNYRFLLCANEIQVAYALDRKSLEHSQDYVDRFNGLNPNTMVPNREPPVPMTVPLAVKIVRAVPGTPYVATIRDGTAGEALGMSCFTGQTARVGFVAKLIGPQATRPQIKAYIDLLRADDITPGASLGYALINPAVPAPPTPAPRPRAPVRRKAS